VNTGFLSGSQAEKAEESVALKRKLIEEYLEKQAKEK
jgi:protein FAM50